MGCKDLIAVVSFSSLENLRGGIKRSRCFGDSGVGLSDLCQQGLVAAKPGALLRAKQSRFNGFVLGVLRSLEPEIQAGSWRGVALPW